jgi:two-component system, NtrC family, sensor histidine kinase HydH
MPETIFDELKRYVRFCEADERALRALHAGAAPRFPAIADAFYERILGHEGARAALVGGESRVGQLKVTMVGWLDSLLRGPWDEAYWAHRTNIGRVHVRIGLPQHYMFGAMNVIRVELAAIAYERFHPEPAQLQVVRDALGKTSSRSKPGSSGSPPSVSSWARSATTSGTRSASSRPRCSSCAGGSGRTSGS